MEIILINSATKIKETNISYFFYLQPSIHSEIMAMFNKVSVESSAAYNTKDSEVTHGYRYVHVNTYIIQMIPLHGQLKHLEN